MNPHHVTIARHGATTIALCFAAPGSDAGVIDGRPPWVGPR